RCFITEILVKKKGSQKGGTLDPVNDFILWYGRSEKRSGRVKIRPIYEIRNDAEVFEDFPHVELPSGERCTLKDMEEPDGAKYGNSLREFTSRYPNARLFAVN